MFAVILSHIVCAVSTHPANCLSMPMQETGSVASANISMVPSAVGHRTEPSVIHNHVCFELNCLGQKPRKYWFVDIVGYVDISRNLCSLDCLWSKGHTESLIKINFMIYLFTSISIYVKQNASVLHSLSIQNKGFH